MSEYYWQEEEGEDWQPEHPKKKCGYHNETWDARSARGRCNIRVIPKLNYWGQQNWKDDESLGTGKSFSNGKFKDVTCRSWVHYEILRQLNWG